MGQIHGIILLLVLMAVTVILFLQRSLREAVIEAINNFRGGPPTTMHPSPSDDSVLLRRRSRKTGD
jgi:hypothetical protein